MLYAVFFPQTVKGGMEVQYRALVTVGNLHGVGGFAIGKSANPAEAITEASRSNHEIHHPYSLVSR